MNKLFERPQIKTTLGLVNPHFKGSVGTAGSTIAASFGQIGNVLAEGNVLPEYMEIAGIALAQAKVTVDWALQHGFNGGKSEY